MCDSVRVQVWPLVGIKIFNNLKDFSFPDLALDYSQS